MKPLDLSLVYEFVNANIMEFHQGKIRSLENLRLHRLLKRKNPYMFKAKNIVLAQDMVQGLLEAHISSSEEELFGQFLEQLAIFIAQQTCDGIKSTRPGIDLEFAHDDFYNIVQIKSGPNWGNSSQQKRLETDLYEASASIRQQLGEDINVRAVLGVCYGKTRTRTLRGYLKVVGQNFWYFISENPRLYTEIVEPIGYNAKHHNEEFNKQKGRVINVFTEQFLAEFCQDGVIDWDKIIALNSANLDLPTFLTST